jgi:hypothetical protein
MTDFDELTSAYLDGEVTADERATVEADRALMARVDELRAVRGFLSSATSAPVAPDRRDTAIANALTAAAPTAGQPVPETESPRQDIHTLETAGRAEAAPRRRWRVVLGISGVAAAIAIAVGVAAAVSRSSSTPTAGRDSSATTLARATPALAPGAPPSTTTARAATAGAATPAVPPAATTAAATAASTAAAAPSTSAPSAAAGVLPLADLGVLSDAASVRAAVATTAAPASPIDPCSLAPARLTGRAQWSGVPVYVYVLDGRALVVATADCGRLAEVPLS